MATSDALWEMFKATGQIGAYLLYRECSVPERYYGLRNKEELMIADGSMAE